MPVKKGIRMTNNKLTSIFQNINFTSTTVRFCTMMSRRRKRIIPIEIFFAGILISLINYISYSLSISDATVQM
jgi:hypothetical protein